MWNVTSTSNKLIEQYQDVFEGLGCIGEDYHIEIDEIIQPVQSTGASGNERSPKTQTRPVNQTRDHHTSRRLHRVD